MSSRTDPPELASTFLRLGNDARVESLPVGSDFWERIASGELGSFHNEYLVSSHGFESDWGVWEMHPHGDEVVCLLDGAVTFVLEEGDAHREVRLERQGAFVVVPKGVWHTARTDRRCSLLFITAGEGTMHRAASQPGADTEDGSC